MGIKEIVIFQKRLTDIGGGEIFALNLLNTNNVANGYNLVMIVLTISDKSRRYIDEHYCNLADKIIVLNTISTIDSIKALHRYYKENNVFFTISSYGYKELFIVNRLISINYYILYHDLVVLEEFSNQKYSFLVRRYAECIFSKDFFSHLYGKKVSFIKNTMHTLNYFLTKVMLIDATRVCVLSKISANEKKALYNINPLIIKAALTEECISNNGSMQKEKYFLSVARLVKKKNIHKIIFGFHEYLKKYENNYVLKIVGSGPYREDLIELVDELGIKKYVKFYGFVSHEEKVNLFNHASLFLCLDDADYDLTFYEALASKTQVLCSEAFEVETPLIDNNNVLKTRLDSFTIAYNINKSLSKVANWDYMENYLIKNVSFENYIKRLIQINT